MSNYFDVMSVGFTTNQMALKPYMSYMDDFTQFGKFTRSLGGASNAFGRMATATGVVGLGFEYQSMKQGDVSMSRFGYHIAGFGASVGVGAAFGNLPGAAAGGVFWAGETIYDNIIVPGINMVWELEMKLRSMHERILYW